MNRLLNWLKLRIEKSPIRFVMIGGPIAYGLGMTILALTFIPIARDPLQPDILYVFYLNMAIGSSLPIAFHWFVARYERKAVLAQVIALIPAVFLFGIVSLGAGMIGVKTQSCIEDPETGEVRDCQSGFRLITDNDRGSV